MSSMQTQHSFARDCMQKSKTKMLSCSLPNATSVSLEYVNMLGEGKAYKAYEVLKDCT